MAKHKNSKTFLVGRNATTGEFVSAKVAHRHPKSVTVERIPKSGRGDVPEPLRHVVAPKSGAGNKKRK